MIALASYISSAGEAITRRSTLLPVLAIALVAISATLLIRPILQFVGGGSAWLAWLDALSGKNPTLFSIAVTLIAAPIVGFITWACRVFYRTISERMFGESPAASAARAPWEDLQTGKSLLDKGMPPVGRAPAEVGAKAALYGGRPSLDSGARDYVARGQTFDRQTVSKLGEMIRHNRDSYSSFTLQADRGAGLSLALAQLVRDFSRDPSNLVVSKIGDRNGTRDFLDKMDIPEASEVTRWLKSLEWGIKRVLIVIDDVSRHAGIKDGQLVALKNSCRDGVRATSGRKITFVFGSFGTAQALHDTDKVELELTKGDRDACYEMMAVSPPTIIEGVQGIVADGRTIEDDAQALIDFYLQNGKPIGITRDNWLARTDDLSPEQLEVVEIVAAAALLGLDIPERVALHLCRSRGFTEFFDAGDIAQWTDRLMVLESADYGGVATCVGLSCSARAISILRRSGNLTDPFIEQVLGELVAVALDLSEDGGREGDQALEFARHVFQRLGNASNWQFGDKNEIGAAMLFFFILRLDALCDRWSADLLAKWAGSITPWMDRHINRMLREPCIEFVARLAEQCLDRLEKGEDPMAPQIAVSIFRAARRLPREGDRRLPARLQTHILRVQRRVVTWLKPDDVVGLVGAQLEGHRTDDQRRANELVTAYAKYRASRLIERDARDFPPQPACKELVAVFDGAALAGMVSDAATLLEQARFTWVASNDKGAHQAALLRRKELVDQASDCVRQNPVTQANWQTSIETLGMRLTREPQARGTEKT